MSAAEWQQAIEKAYAEYTMGSKGFYTTYDVHTLLNFMSKRSRHYPELSNERIRRMVGRYIDVFLSQKFGPLWDGRVYVENRARHQPGSLAIATENAVALIARSKGD